MAISLPVINLAEAKFECTFGRGCDGICCHNGRPPVFEKEGKRIARNLKKIRPLLRREAQAVLDRGGFVSQRRKAGQPVARVVKGWCIFFNEGCVLHKLGAAEGDAYRYKPLLCALFPLDMDTNGEWYVRQRGVKGEAWDLFCLDPKASPRLAAESLQEELELAKKSEAMLLRESHKAARRPRR